jgi:hypothetical protein
MNLVDLQNLVAAYHQGAPSIFQQNGTDVFLTTLNSIRQSAEKKHDFEFTRCRATLSIDGVAGGSLDDAIIYDPPTQINVSSDDTTVIGTYTQLPMFNGHWAYTTDNNYWIYWNSFYNSYVISDALVDGERAYVWLPATVRILPEGDYNHITISGETTATAVRQNELGSVKQIVAIQRMRSDGRIVPMDFARSDVPIERDRYITELRDDMWPIERYPSDAQILTSVGRATLIQRRRQVFIYPPYVAAVPCPPISIQIEGLGFLNDWTEDDLGDTPPDPNWFVENGFDWMKWKLIYELNPLFSTFVPRQEGNIANDPKVLKEYIAEAWDEFVTWDAYQIDANTTRSR